MAPSGYRGAPLRGPLIVVVAVGALLAAAVVAIGGGGGPNFGFDPPEDFRAAADSACLDQAKEAARTQMERGQARSAAGAADAQRAIAASDASFDEAFERLDPPMPMEDRYAAYLDARARVARGLDRYTRALGSNRSGVILAARRTLDAARARQWDAGEALGLRSCSGRLDASSQRQAVEVVREVDTSSDPAKVCDGMVFESYVESAFGSYRRCKRFQRESANTAKAIDVERVTGVGDVSATVDFRDVAGPFDGRPLRASLFFSGGRWLLWNVVELSE